MRLAFDLFVQKDLGVNGVAARLTALGAPTRKGGAWSRNTLRHNVYKLELKEGVYA